MELTDEAIERISAIVVEAIEKKRACPHTDIRRAGKDFFCVVCDAFLGTED